MDQVKHKAKITVFHVAATYIGTVVGAGFASGQEVLQFFGYFGLNGVWALMLTTALFVFFGWIILDLGMRLHATSHLPVIRHAGGKWVGTAVDYVITFFLFGALTAMAAGAGAIFSEQFGLPPILGNAVMVIAAVLTVMMGLGGVVTAISFVVPVLLAAVVGISLWTLFSAPLNLTAAAALPGKAAVPFWPLSAVVYVSYNIVMAVAVLAPMGARVEARETLKRGAIFGGIGLGIGALAILLALLANLPQAARYQIPMVYIAGRFAPAVQYIYSLVLFAEIYTTAVGNLYGFVARVTDVEVPKARLYIIGIGIAAFLASQLGFTTLVRVLYPSVGYAGLLLLGGLLYGLVRERRA
ncbi:MAG: hypothetical protein ACOY4Q_03815 [Bacillota bacterium]